MAIKELVPLLGWLGFNQPLIYLSRLLIPCSYALRLIIKSRISDWYWVMHIKLLNWPIVNRFGWLGVNFNSSACVEVMFWLNHFRRERKFFTINPNLFGLSFSLSESSSLIIQQLRLLLILNIKWEICWIQLPRMMRLPWPILFLHLL
jgi:hypothetical protein